MYTYKDTIVNAHKYNIVKRIADRENGNNFNKLDTALSTNSFKYIMLKNKRTGVTMPGDDHRKCPTLYEAEAVDFNRQTLNRENHIVKRCQLCTRILHPLVDTKTSICSFCLNKLVTTKQVSNFCYTRSEKK
ncbi:HESP034 [Hemileuca sp. nucleopolyhedrovirus]|uniref:HESP034 n=1 Tax=Hemileuca sp. nucleopolyhedrovirus TaxID=1367203 RepID=S5MK08_9ABAC|nr:HESP034 [Hemileuca sp. nucleopolyhedrovirus]AGR56786.1 HESP034 [Hemileuca sp. nucleopolyhedrovirus]